MGRGIHRGFITHEELNKSLGKRNLSSENLSQAFIHMLDESIVLVEKKSDYKILRKKDASSKEDEVAVSCYYDGAPEYRVEVIAPDYKLAEKAWVLAQKTVEQMVTSAGGSVECHRE